MQVKGAAQASGVGFEADRGVSQEITFDGFLLSQSERRVESGAELQ
jgi:hypothetical protein